MKLHGELLDDGLVVGLPTAGHSPNHSRSQPGSQRVTVRVSVVEDQLHNDGCGLYT